MKILSYLLKNARSVVIIAVILGLCSGIYRTFFILTVNKSSLQSTQTFFFDLLIFAAAMSLTNILSQMILNKISLNSVFILRLHLTKQIFALKTRKLEQIGAPKLLAVLTQDIQNIANALAVSPTILIYVTTVLSGFVYLYLLSFKIFLLGTLFLVVGSFLFRIVHIKALSQFEKGRAEEDTLFKHFEALTTNMQEFKSNWNKRYIFFHDFLSTSANNDKMYSIKGLNFFTLGSGISEFFLFLFLSVLLGFASHYLNIEHSTVLSIVMLFLFLITPVIILLNILPSTTKGVASINNLENLGITLDAVSVHDDLSIQETIEQKKSLHVFNNYNKLTCKDIVFQFRDDNSEDLFQVGPISLEFSPSMITFLIGGNGSGKTTLAKIIAGLYAPDKGEIILDGKNISNDNRDWYRQLFSNVWTNFYLTEGLFNEPTSKTTGNMEFYLKKLRLDHKVKIINGKLTTVNLSQGQKKRLALLNAWLEDRPFYIFDEWAADQDPVFKHFFYTELLPEMKARGKTVLAITHDDRYFHLADKVLFLEYGKLKENFEEYTEKNYYRFKKIYAPASARE